METITSKQGKLEIVEPLKKISKLKYGKPKAEVEQEIIQRSFVEIQQPPPVPPTDLGRATPLK